MPDVIDYSLFEARPGIGLLLQPNLSQYIIVAASNDFFLISVLKRADVIGKDIFAILPQNPNDNDLTSRLHLKASFEAVLENKTPHSLAHQRLDIPNGDGSFKEKYWKVLNVPVLGEDGTIRYIIHTLEEVTPQIKVDERDLAFRTIEQNFSLFMQAPVAICMVYGPDYIVEVANESMLQFLGRTPEMIGRPIIDSLTEAKVQGLIDILDHVRQTGKSYSVDGFPASIIINNVREERYFNLVFKPFYPVTENGEVSSIFCVGHNVTEQVLSRRKSEESSQELQLAIEIADLGTFRLDLISNKATNSDKVNEWFGYEVQGYSREEGFNPIHPEDRERVDEAILQTLQSEEKSRHDVTYRVIHPVTGVIRHLRSIGKALFNEKGTPYLIIGIIQDITAQVLHRKQLEASEVELQQRVLERTIELEHLNQELKRSNANLEEFAYAASHDMKEPIRKIHFFANRLRQQLYTSLTEEQTHLFSRMEHAAQRMNGLIEDLLTYSHFTKGVSVVETVDLNNKVRLVLEDLELEIEEKKAVVTTTTLPTITGHKRQLQQLFQNLISNALKYNKPGVAPVVHISSKQVLGKEVPLSLKGESAQQSFHLIEVTDNGIGFDQEDAQRIFKVFTRLHGKAEYAGTGIGLSIAQKVVENHKGYIWAESTPGEGASFKMLLPVS